MRARTWIAGAGLVLFGLALGLLAPSLRAQAPTTVACTAGWELYVGAEMAGGASVTGGGWHAVKWNRCTGEALVFSSPNHKPDEKAAWYRLPVKP